MTTFRQSQTWPFARGTMGVDEGKMDPFQIIQIKNSVVCGRQFMQTIQSQPPTDYNPRKKVGGACEQSDSELLLL